MGWFSIFIFIFWCPLATWLFVSLQLMLGFKQGSAHALWSQS